MKDARDTWIGHTLAMAGLVAVLAASMGVVVWQLPRMQIMILADE